MNDHEKQFEKIAAGLNIDDRPNTEHKQVLRKQMLDACKDESSDKTAPRIQPTWSRIMKSNLTKSAAAAIITVGILIPLAYGATRIIKKLMIKPAWRGEIVMDFKQDKDIYFDVRVGTKEEPEIILGHDIRFFVEDGQLLGTLRSAVCSWPKFKWHTHIDILDDMGKSIASTDQIRDNGGIKHHDYREEYTYNIHFSLGPWDDALQEQAKRIRVRFEQVSDDVAVTPDAWIESSELEVLHGRVSDVNGEPVANAVVHIREKRKKDQKSIAAKDVFTDQQGYYSFDEINWPYTVGVIVYDQDSSGQKHYHQFKKLNRTLHGTQNIDFGFEEFPRGTAVLSGWIVKPDGSPATEFTIDVRNKVDWKDCPDQYLHQYGVKKSFVSQDGGFEIVGLASGERSVGVVLTGKEFEGLDFDPVYFQVDCELVDGETTEVTNESLIKESAKEKAALNEGVSYYGRVLYKNGKPAVPPTSPWEGAKVYTILRYTDATPTHGGLTERIGDVDKQGFFTVNLTDEQFEKIKAGKYSIEIYHPSYAEEFHSYRMARFPAEMLTQDSDELQEYSLPSEVMSNELEHLEQILKSYDMLHELGTPLLHWSEKHSGKFPASLELISFDNAETQTWVMENIEYQGGETTKLEIEAYPIAYDKKLLESLKATHVLFSNGKINFLQQRKLELIERIE